MKACCWVLAICCTLANATERDPAVKRAWRKTHPCPSTGLTHGACPGWQVDHHQALVCGGRDEPSNLQWLELTEHQEKTRRDMRGCRLREK